MALGDKLRCAGCGHPRYKHTGNHYMGSRTACLQRVEAHPDDPSDRSVKICDCIRFTGKGSNT